MYRERCISIQEEKGELFRCYKASYLTRSIIHTGKIFINFTLQYYHCYRDSGIKWIINKYIIVTCYNYEVFTNYMKEFVLIILKLSIFHVIFHWRTTIREQNRSLFQLILIQIAIVFCRDDLENGKLENIRLDAKWKYRDRIATIRFLIVHRVLSVTTIAMSTIWLRFIDQNLTFLTKLIKKIVLNQIDWRHDSDGSVSYSIVETSIRFFLWLIDFSLIDSRSIEDQKR